MLNHYERRAELERGYERANIDSTRTALNYEIGQRAVKERIEECVELHNAAGRALRQDATLMVDWVVTAPENVPEERLREFFTHTLEFVQQRYGADNAPIAYIHMDEKRPHAHIPVIPFNQEKERLQASSIINRTDLKTFHGALGDYLEQRMGYRPEVELTEEHKQERALKYTEVHEYKNAKDALEKELPILDQKYEELLVKQQEISRMEQEQAERLELVRQRQRDIESEHKQLKNTEQQLTRANEQLEKRIEPAKEQIAEQRQYLQSDARENRELGERAAELEQSRNTARERVVGLTGRKEILEKEVQEIKQSIGERANELKLCVHEQAHVDREVETSQNKRTQLLKEIGDLIILNSSLYKELSGLKSSSKMFENSHMRQRIVELNTSTEQIGALLEQMNSLSSELESLEGDSRISELDLLQSKYETLKTELSTLNYS